MKEGLEKDVSTNGSVGGCVGHKQCGGGGDVTGIAAFVFGNVFLDVREGSEGQGAGNGRWEVNANGEVTLDGAYGIGWFGVVLLFLCGGVDNEKICMVAQKIMHQYFLL